MTASLFARVVPIAAAGALALGMLVVPGKAWAQAASDPVTITIEVALPAEAHNTPRDWYFEIADTTGAVADAVTVSTSAQSPAGSITRTLPPGNYRVDYLFTDQVAESCGETTFFALAGPIGATASVTADGSTLDYRYEFEACPASSLPLGSVVQDSEAAPMNSTAVEVTVSESAGQVAPKTEPRFASAPLPPDTGSGLAAESNGGGLPWAATWLGFAALAGVVARTLCR